MQKTAKNASGETVVFFSPHKKIGATGQAIMCAMVDEAETIIDANTLEKMEMEDLLNKEEIKKKIIDGTMGPCSGADMSRLFPADEKKK